jgi:AcrR family transcriptional regulator
MDERRARIEAAARELFIRRGFHATSMRDIAQSAGASLGNLYNYYRTKEDILGSIIARYQKVIDARLRAIFDEIEEPFRPDSLVRFGRMIRELVSAHSDFWLLMYIDVLEFENRHFRKMFQGLAAAMRRRYAAQFAALRREGALYDGVDPAVGFTAAYMQFFNYFLVEKLFGGKGHLGLSDDQAIKKLAEIFCRGVLRPEKLRQLATPAAAARRPRRPARRAKAAGN